MSVHCTHNAQKASLCENETSKGSVFLDALLCTWFGLLANPQVALEIVDSERVACTVQMTIQSSFGMPKFQVSVCEEKRA